MLDDRNEAALADFTAAVALDPNLPHALANRGYLLNRLGRFEEAFADLERALALAPHDDDVRYHAALVELLHGRWREGFEHYDARLTARSLDTTRIFVPPAHPRWNGEPPDGNLLVLFTEQGRGDVIQFARFATELSKSGHRVAIATQPAYASMFASIAGIERIIVDTDELASLAPLRWQMLVSVPGSLGMTPEAIPASAPYMAADPQRRAAWQKKLGGGFKIGISWQGSPTFVHDRGRSIPLAAFAPLADVPDVRLISLQKRPGAEQIANVPFRGRIEQVLDVSDTSDSAFLDTVALVDTLDLVVTSDSMNAHLAGALGKPTFVALRKIPDWRWLLGRDDCPWYPSARLFRQTDGWRLAGRIPADRGGRQSGGRLVGQVRSGRRAILRDFGFRRFDSGWLLSQSRAARCAWPISASLISAAISRRMRAASTWPFIAAMLNHLCADDEIGRTGAAGCMHQAELVERLAACVS